MKPNEEDCLFQIGHMAFDEIKVLSRRGELLLYMINLAAAGNRQLQEDLS